VGPVWYLPSLPPLVPVEALALLGGEGGGTGGPPAGLFFPSSVQKVALFASHCNAAVGNWSAWPRRLNSTFCVGGPPSYLAWPDTIVYPSSDSLSFARLPWQAAGGNSRPPPDTLRPPRSNMPARRSIVFPSRDFLRTGRRQAIWSWLSYSFSHRPVPRGSLITSVHNCGHPCFYVCLPACAAMVFNNLVCNGHSACIHAIVRVHFCSRCYGFDNSVCDGHSACVHAFFSDVTRGV
jgi:hypothetical protein